MRKPFCLILSTLLLVAVSACGNQPQPEPTPVLPSDAEMVLDFYAVNDFHGSVLERKNGNYYEGGLLKVGGFLKDKKEEKPNSTFLISSGDMWQGSLESNDNYGNLVTEAMNTIGFDSMTLGNHEFDYGVDRIEANKRIATFPFLAGNIMKWENGKASANPWGVTQASTVIERGKHRVGIIGMIGQGQTSSITSKNVKDIAFVDPMPLAKAESERLKKEQKCDTVILSVHNAVRTVTAYSDLKEHFDAVFCAHSHQEERKKTIDGVPLLQGACNGEMVSHIQLTYDQNGKSVCTAYENIKASADWNENAKILAVQNKYIGTDEFVAKSTEVLTNLEGYLDKDGVARLGTRAIYEEYVKQYPDLCCAMENGQRATLNGGEITYSDLYKATPFTNKIVIANVTGKDIKRESGYNSTYTGDTARFATVDDDAYYTVAVIDYLLYHQDTSKQYDYFMSLNGHEDHVLAEFETYPVDLSAKYLKTLGGSVSYLDFASNAPGYNLYI